MKPFAHIIANQYFVRKPLAVLLTGRRSISMCLLLSLFFWGCRDQPGVDFESIRPELYSLDSLNSYVDAKRRIEMVKAYPRARQQVDSLLYWTELMKNYNEKAARAYAEEAIRITTEKNLKLSRAISLYYLAALKEEQNMWGESLDVALVDAKMSLRLIEGVNQKRWLVKANNLVGGIYYKKYQTDSAFIYLHRALDILGKASLPESLSLSLKGKIYHDLANVCEEDQDSLSRTLHYYQKSLAIIQKANNPAALARLQHAMGVFYQRQGESHYPKAENKFYESLKTAVANKDSAIIADSYQELGQLRRLQYRSNPNDTLFQEGMNFFDTCLQYQKENRFRTYDLIGKLYQGKIAFQYQSLTPEQRLTFLDSAILFYQRALIEIQKEGTFEYIETTVKDILELCDWRARRFNEDCSTLLKAPTWKFVNSTYEAVLDSISYKLEAANLRFRKFEREQQEAVNQNRIQGIWLISGVSLIFAALVFLILLQRQQQKRLQARMEALRAQINPHFMSNSLNAIESLVNRDEKQAASKYLIHFSRLTRRILNSSRNSQTSLADELKTLEHFLALEQLRFRDKLKYTIETAPGLDPQSVEVPAMILQPYIENAILHGIKPKTESGHLLIRAEKDGKKLLCIIEDDGIGRKKSQELKTKSVFKHKSHGMAITEERIKAFGKVKGAKVEIEDLYHEDGRAAGTRVRIQLPWKERPKPEIPDYLKGLEQYKK